MRDAAAGVGSRWQIGVVALAAVALAAVALVACSPAGPAAPGPSVGQRMDAAVPAAVSSLTLVTSTGAHVGIDSFAGKVVVISDMMTLCQETCPIDTADMVEAADEVERAGLGGRVEFLSVTIDPQRDTPARLAAYRRLFAPAPADWLLATSTPQGLARLWSSLGVYIQKVPDTPPAPTDWLTGQPLTYDLTHSDEVFVLDGTQRERFLLEGAPHLAPGTTIPPTLAEFMDATGHDALTHPDPEAWTLPQELQVIGWLTHHTITPGPAS